MISVDQRGLAFPTLFPLPARTRGADEFGRPVFRVPENPTAQPGAAGRRRDLPSVSIRPRLARRA